jgi:hypothetical protein
VRLVILTPSGFDSLESDFPPFRKIMQQPVDYLSSISVKSVVEENKHELVFCDIQDPLPVAMKVPSKLSHLPETCG